MRGVAASTRRRTIGLVGYPNVGKSSTVNVLVSEKKTSVSATPGKTKHFQTLVVPDLPDVTLCDCPGLVFPTLAGSKAQMVCDGILPIDQMKSDYMTPIRLLCERLSQQAFERCYALRLRSDAARLDDPDMPELARELLVAHALARGYSSTTHGAPDESRSARVILKDLVNAKLLHTMAPPGMGAHEAFGDSNTLRTSEAVESAIEAAGLAGRSAQLPSGRKLPAEPTTQRYLDRMKADYEAQEGVGAAFASTMGGRSKHGKAGVVMGGVMGEDAGATPASMNQWQPRYSTDKVPDRLVAGGRKVEM